jgi:hypothetical protein
MTADVSGEIVYIRKNGKLTYEGIALLQDIIAGAGGGGGATDLSYNAATRLLTSSTGTDATLPLVTSPNAGLAPASGGGTDNFLRADGTWTLPSGGADGLPAGGIMGQILTKQSATDYDADWSAAILVDGDFLVDDGGPDTEGSLTAWPGRFEYYYSNNVADMTAIVAGALTDGQFIQTKGYYTAGDGGGATYRVMTSGAFGGTPDEYGDHTLLGGFVAKLERTVFYPAQYGVGQDGSGRTGAQNKTAMNAMIAKMNASVAPVAVTDGQWTVAGGLDYLTAEYTTVTALGVGRWLRDSTGIIFRTYDAEYVADQLPTVVPDPPSYVTVEKQEIDGGWDGVNSLTQATISLEADFGTIAHCRTYNSGGISVKGTLSRAIHCDIWDTNGGGLSVGKSNATLCFGNSVRNSGGEGIQCDNGINTRIIGNYVSDSGGVGGFGANEIDGVLWMGNHAIDNNNGGIVNGNKGDNESLNSAMIGNVLNNNGTRGIQLRSFYTTMPVTGITQADPAVVTFPQVTITVIDGTVTPVRITAPGHGISNGDRRCITGTPLIGAFTGPSFPKIWKCEVIDPNTIDLWDENGFLEDPLVGSGTWAAAITSRISHPYRRTGNPSFNREGVTFSGVVGMVEINGLKAYCDTATDTTVELYALPNLSSTVGFDTSTFTAYASGGIASFGTGASDFTITSNVIASSAVAIRVERPDPGPERDHLFMGNSVKAEKVQHRNPAIMNFNKAVRHEAIRPNQNNVTGNGTDYIINFANSDERYDTDGMVSAGVFTAPGSAIYAFSGGVRLDGMGATVTAAQLSIVHLEALPSTTIKKRIDTNLVPNGGVTTAGTWRGAVSAFFFMEKDERVNLRVQVSGLGADSADLVGTGGETFLHINAMG